MSNKTVNRVRTFFWTAQAIEEHGLEKLIRVNSGIAFFKIIMVKHINKTDVKVVVNY